MNVVCMSVTIKPQNEEALAHWVCRAMEKYHNLPSNCNIHFFFYRFISQKISEIHRVTERNYEIFPLTNLP